MIPIVATTLVYLRGWMILQRRGAKPFNGWRLAAFCGGMAGLLIALASPLDAFAPLLLRMHMIQHLLLIFVVPPLIWLGAPELPLLCGLPGSVRRQGIAPLYRTVPLRRAFHFLTKPAVAWGLFVGTTWLWHLPRLYDAALVSETLHNLEHASFFWSAMLFWWPAVQPYPSRPRTSRWYLLPYLFLAALQGTVLSGLFSFSNDVIYDHYKALPPLWGISPLDDQAVAGTLMWVVGMIVYATSAALIGYQLLFAQSLGRLNFIAAASAPTRNPAAQHSSRSLPPRKRPPTRVHRPQRSHDLPVISSAPARVGPDLLQVPLLGRFLRWKRARTALQILLLAAAAVVIVDGLFGTPVVSLNLAGVLPWIYWRGFLVIGLLVAGNLFCMACPFQLPRKFGKKWLGGQRRWPRALRSKWLAVGLLVLFFWAYEVFSLWRSPWWTAWIAVGYFVAAWAVDGFFRGAAFCKYVCPIGQFNFVQSLVSPLEVRVRDGAVCADCTTKDCIRGAAATENGPAIPGCELHLYQPRKSGNLDCTFCLDCVHACPHANVGILTTWPGETLLSDPRRSGLGILSRRSDVAALVWVLVFAAFVNAAGMVTPVMQWIDAATNEFGFAGRWPMVTAAYLAGILVIPALCVGGASLIGRRLSGNTESLRRIATRFAYMFVPLGFAMWLAHYSFHLFSSSGAFTAAFRRFLSDAGWPGITAASWTCSCGAETADWLMKLELLMLDGGLLLSLYLGYRIARDRSMNMSAALGAFLPWATIALLLFAAGVWILFQPMEMRGAMPL